METTRKLTINKATRLAWLLFYRMSGGKMSKAEYARLFGIHPSNAGTDQEDLESLEKQVKKIIPQVGDLLGQIFSPDELADLPVYPVGLGDYSDVSVNFRVFHHTGDLVWEPFVQKIYQDKDKLAEIKIKKGGTKLKKNRQVEKENQIW